MHHSQSYPVTKVPPSPPQPHVTYGSKTPGTVCSGWCSFVTAGVVAIVFLVCIYVLWGPKLFITGDDRSAGLVLTIKQGFLEVYPFAKRLDTGIDSRYFSRLPPRNLSRDLKTLDALFQTYPDKHEGVYRNCWLENPSPDHPCFVDVSWISEACSRNYGYEESDGHYSPCFIMRLEQTEDWRPRFTEYVPKAVADHYDPGFAPVYCFAQGDRGQDLSLNITIYPPKGFSHLFFPASRFNPDTYLLPMVAVKVNRIPKARNLTVECSVVTPNAFFLWNNGKVVIRLEAA